MKHETKLGTVENIVTAICVGMGVLLVVLAVYTLFAVKSVNANGPYGALSDASTKLGLDDAPGAGSALLREGKSASEDKRS